VPSVQWHPPTHSDSCGGDPLLGSVINGKYRVVDVAGSGGMGKVYKAEQIPLGRLAAIKTLNTFHTRLSSDRNDERGFERRFFLEASILSKLQHPNLVTVFDYGCIEGSDPPMYFMAMEYLDGVTLERKVHDRHRLDATDLLPIARQIARGLQDAHANGVIHRDLKPSNVMLVPRPDGSSIVKILDFGLVKVLDAESDKITREGTFLGSARYTAPEQITHGDVDCRSDIYSLGILMYEALCGVPPFERKNLVQTLAAHMYDAVPAMASVAEGVCVPESVEEFVRWCLAKSPSDRPSDMGAVLDAIAQCSATLGLPTTSSDRYDVDVSASGHPLHVAGRSDAARSAGQSDQRRVPVQGFISQVGTADTIGMSDPMVRSVETSIASTKKIWIAVAVALALIGTAGAVFIMTNPWGTSDEHRVPTVATVPVAEVQSSASQPPPSDFVRSFVVVINSTPSGAEVFEGDVLLGTTPMQLSLENDVVRATPKRLTISTPGHNPYSILQGPSDRTVEVDATLQPHPATTDSVEPPKVQRPPATGGARPPTATTTTPRKMPTTTSQPPGDPGIREHR